MYSLINISPGMSGMAIKQKSIKTSNYSILESHLFSRLLSLQVDSIPWYQIFTSVPVWAIIVAHMAENWGYYTLLTSLPTYLKMILKFDIQKVLHHLPKFAMHLNCKTSSFRHGFLGIRFYVAMTVCYKYELSLLIREIFCLVLAKIFKEPRSIS